MRADDPIPVGVIGVGSMGRHHARVYEELPGAELVGVHDADAATAREIADTYAVEVLSRDELLAAVEAVSVAVPTPYHLETARACVEAEVAALIEKPVVGDLDDAVAMRSLDRSSAAPLQVGHIERFNPAISTLTDIVADLDVLSIRAERLGPPPERAIADSAAFDLMTHDLDIVRSLLGQDPDRVEAVGVDENRHVTALLEFPCGIVTSLTASRKTQRKVRTLEVTAESCFIEVDYIDQSIDIHRHSVPEYIEEDGNIRYRHESVVERPHVPNGEPLRFELEAFLDAVSNGTEPAVTIDDGLRVIELAEEIEQAALGAVSLSSPPQPTD